MDRKAMAKETLAILERGCYEAEGRQIDIRESLERSVTESVLITPEEGAAILEKYKEKKACPQPETRVGNLSAVEAVRRLWEEGKTAIGLLNFASAKNPGGGFLNGAKAQEETLTVSSTLYPTLTAHEEYYQKNRAHRSMMYLDYSIYSPEVLFVRDSGLCLTGTPVKASVLTLPAVNMGQVRLKGENETEARRVMRRRMKLALGIFAERGAKHLVLGAYGCGVFRNDPRDIAAWWRELLAEGMGAYFETIYQAVLDSSRDGRCIKAFLNE